MAKPVQKLHARSLRKHGISIKKIAEKLNVSAGSVSNWCRDIELSAKQLALLEKQAKDPFYGKRALYLAKLKKKQDYKIAKLIREGSKEIGKLTRRELFLVGVALYWGEGFKKDKQVGIANQDPYVIRMFIKWLQVCFGVKTSDLIARVTINITHKSRIEDIQRYWSNQIRIPMQEFRKPTYQNIRWKKYYQNPNNYYGVLRIKVRKSIDFLRKISGFIEGLKTNSI
jgi:transcriptional regulator with XRE-family HTH domain